MKKYSLLYFTKLIIFLGSISVNAQSKTITWSKNYRLTWDDYQATPDSLSYGTAKTVYKIAIVPEYIETDENDHIIGYEKLTTQTLFYKNLSWSKSKDKHEQELLDHEQLHFDIAELYSKKIKLRFKELQRKKIASFNTYQIEYNRLWKECRKTQKKFDFETEHGLISKENSKWEVKIKNELALFNNL